MLDSLSLQVSRRSLLASGVSLAGLSMLGGLPLTAEAAPAGGPSGDVAAALTADSMFFEPTGHTVTGAFWTFWKTYGLDGFGYPISEVYEDGGVRNQYFQRARFELAPDGTVRLGLLGIEAGGAEPPAAPTDTAPTGDAPASTTPTAKSTDDPAAKPGAGATTTATKTGDDKKTNAAPSVPPDTLLVEETGHTVAGAFLAEYKLLKAVLGPPIGREQVTPNGGYMQYFAHARLEWDKVHGTRLGLLGSELASAKGIATDPVPAPTGATRWSDYVAAATADEADRRAFAAKVTSGSTFVPSFGQKWVVVNLSQQRVTAYEHTKQVFTDLCSSGAPDKGLSTKGVFAIARRVANETMDSTTIGYPKGSPKYYHLENVLYTQYYNGGEALHYAWWHNNFGRPMSYGCINLRLATAKWFWDWATVGTPVIVV